MIAAGLAAAAPKLSKREAAVVVKNFVEIVSLALTSGDRVEIRGLGSIIAREYKSKKVINSRSNKEIFVPERTGIYFRVSQRLVKMLNERQPLIVEQEMEQEMDKGLEMAMDEVTGGESEKK